jgi:hypothetical protein
MSVAILDFRPAAAPGNASTAKASAELLRLLGLEALPARRKTLACHWQTDRYHRLFCRWESETVLVSLDQTATTAR